MNSGIPALEGAYNVFFYIVIVILAFAGVGAFAVTAFIKKRKLNKYK